MKKFISALTSVLVMSLPFTGLEAAAVLTDNTKPLIYGESVMAEIGSEVTMDIIMNGNPGAVAVSLEINYDLSYMELISVDNHGLFSGASFTESGSKTTMPYRLMWEDGLSHTNYTDNGVLATLHFKVNPETKIGNYNVDIALDKRSTFNVDLDNVTFETINGRITVYKVVATEPPVTTVTTKTQTTTTIPATTTTTTTTETTTVTEPETTTTEVITTTETSTATEPETTTTEVITTTETSTATEPETTTTEVTSTTEITSTLPETTTTAEISDTTTPSKYICSIAEMRDMAKKDYKARTGHYPDSASARVEDNGFVTIELYDENGILLDTYLIDPFTGYGLSESGHGVSLPQTGYPVSTDTMMTIAAVLILAGLTITAYSFVPRKRED